jgi:hypothetical protein
MAISHHGIHAVHDCQFLRRSLRIAARHHNFRRGIQPVYAANKGARFPICFRRDAAGIHHHNIRLCGCIFRPGSRPQGIPDRFSVGPRRAAAEILDVK